MEVALAGAQAGTIYPQILTEEKLRDFKAHLNRRVKKTVAEFLAEFGLPVPNVEVVTTGDCILPNEEFAHLTCRWATDPEGFVVRIPQARLVLDDLRLAALAFLGPRQGSLDDTDVSVATVTAKALLRRLFELDYRTSAEWERAVEEDLHLFAESWGLKRTIAEGWIVVQQLEGQHYGPATVHDLMVLECLHEASHIVNWDEDTSQKGDSKAKELVADIWAAWGYLDKYRLRGGPGQHVADDMRVEQYLFLTEYLFGPCATHLRGTRAREYPSNAKRYQVSFAILSATLTRWEENADGVDDSQALIAQYAASAERYQGEARSLCSWIGLNVEEYPRTPARKQRRLWDRLLKRIIETAERNRRRLREQRD